jgi:peptide/nickel transport system substrate-binding protein
MPSRRDMKKLVNVLFALIALILIVPACSGGGAIAKHAVRGNFVEGQLTEEAQTLNWLLADDSGASKRYARFMIDPLAVFDNQFKLQLRCLARNIEVSSDGLTYTIEIRDDLKWTDGTKVSADDYVFTLKNLMFSDWLGYSDVATWQETVDGKAVFVNAATVNGTTFRITRKTASPDFLYKIYELMPYPKTIAQHYENKPDQFKDEKELAWASYNGNLGPYKFVTWTSSLGFVVKRNPDYYLGKTTGAPYFETYTIKTYGLKQLMSDDLLNGKISYAYVEPQEANGFRSQGGTNVYAVPTDFYVYLAYNQRDNGWEGLKDPRVRQAISMMIDKAAIVNDLYLGFADPAFSFIPPFSPWYDETVLNKYGLNTAADQQKAVDLIKSAGYEQREINGQMRFVDKAGSPIKLNFLIDVGSDFEQNMAIIIRQCLLNIGLDINPKFSTREVIYAQGLMNKVPGSNQTPAFNNGKGAVSGQPWDLVILSSQANPLSLIGSQEFFRSDGRFNLFGYSDAKVDDLYKRAKSAEAVDPSNRKKIYSELAAAISNAQPVDFLVFYKDNFAFIKNLKGVEPGINMLNTYQFWYFE